MQFSEKEKWNKIDLKNIYKDDFKKQEMKNFFKKWEKKMKWKTLKHDNNFVKVRINEDKIEVKQEKLTK